MDVANYTKHIQDWGFPSLFAILLWNLYTKTNRRNERQSFMWYTHRHMTHRIWGMAKALDVNMRHLQVLDLDDLIVGNDEATAIEVALRYNFSSLNHNFS